MDEYDWKPFLYSDTAAGAVDGEWVFGTSEAVLAGNLVYKIDSVRLLFSATTDSAGNRRLQILFQDSDEDQIAAVASGVNHAAGDSAADAGIRTRMYNFYIGAENKTSFVDTDHLTRTLPDIILPNHWSMKIMDCDSIASDSDKLEIFILGRVASIRSVTT